MEQDVNERLGFVEQIKEIPIMEWNEASDINVGLVEAYRRVIKFNDFVTAEEIIFNADIQVIMTNKANIEVFLLILEHYLNA